MFNCLCPNTLVIVYKIPKMLRAIVMKWKSMIAIILRPIFQQHPCVWLKAIEHHCKFYAFSLLGGIPLPSIFIRHLLLLFVTNFFSFICIKKLFRLFIDLSVYEILFLIYSSNRLDPKTFELIFYKKLSLYIIQHILFSYSPNCLTKLSTFHQHITSMWLLSPKFK